jgi:Fe-S cluster assembly protein SufD
VSTAAADTDVFRQAWEGLARTEGVEPSWRREARARSMDRFLEAGFPGPRDEAWRHTPLAPIVRTRWETAPFPLPPGDLQGLAPVGFRGAEVVLVGGSVSAQHSRLDPGQPGVSVRSLAEVLRAAPAIVEPHLGRLVDGDATVFADLNSALGRDGVVIVVAPGVVVAEPIHVVHLAPRSSGAPLVSCPRVLLVAGAGSECRLVETYAGPADATHLTLAVTEVEVGNNAAVERFLLQREGARSFHVATLAAALGRDARFSNRAFDLGAAIGRTDIDVRFDGEGGSCVLDGLFLVDGERFSDTHSRIDHARPHCSSRELYKGVLGDKGRGVFHGLVVVRPGAQKTDAWQMNRNLLLSRQALVHSTPQLEILADDVKCRHGSTTGQLDPVALFYLRSRGIGEVEARGLLTWAFASDLVDAVPVVPLREALAAHLATWLQAPGLGRVSA